MDFTKTELILLGLTGALITIIIVLIGKLGIYASTGCWGECEPECSTKQCAASIDVKRYGLDGEEYDYHEIPEPSTILLVGAGAAIMLKMRA